MNKAELVEIIAEQAQVTKAQANDIISSFVKAVSSTLAGGEKVTIVGFGSFSVAKRSSRDARNPQTGHVVNVEEKKVAKFKAGKELLFHINKNT